MVSGLAGRERGRCSVPSSRLNQVGKHRVLSHPCPPFPQGAESADVPSGLRPVFLALGTGPWGSKGSSGGARKRRPAWLPRAPSDSRRGTVNRTPTGPTGGPGETVPPTEKRHRERPYRRARPGSGSEHGRKGLPEPERTACGQNGKCGVWGPAGQESREHCRAPVPRTEVGLRAGTRSVF